LTAYARISTAPAGSLAHSTTSEIERISPLSRRHIHLYGHYTINPDNHPDGYRPLRSPMTADTSTSTTETGAINRV
jgi:hypothetical protein